MQNISKYNRATIAIARPKPNLLPNSIPVAKAITELLAGEKFVKILIFDRHCLTVLSYYCTLPIPRNAGALIIYESPMFLNAAFLGEIVTENARQNP